MSEYIAILPRNEKFEKQIAYTFGVANSSFIEKHYIRAEKILDNHKKDTRNNKVKQAMVAEFVECYRSISKQSNLYFFLNKAAELEYDLFIAHEQSYPDEAITTILENIYQLVYGKSSNMFNQAAQKRVRLFKLKTQIEKSGKPFSKDEMAYMIKLHKESVVLIEQGRL